VLSSQDYSTVKNAPGLFVLYRVENNTSLIPAAHLTLMVLIRTTRVTHGINKCTDNNTIEKVYIHCVQMA
jgi:hypothetical protein